MKYPKLRALAGVLLGAGALSFGLATQTLAQSATAKSKETIGGGSVLIPAIGPAPSYGLGGQGMVLVKNWHFGMDGTVKNYADMSANFYYHDQFQHLHFARGQRVFTESETNRRQGEALFGKRKHDGLTLFVRLCDLNGLRVSVEPQLNGLCDARSLGNL